jgi:hypothetical protein
MRLYALLLLSAAAVLIAGCAGPPAAAPEVKDCGDNMTCFQESLKNCSMAKLAQSSTGGGTGAAEIKGLKGGKCEVWMHNEGSPLANGDATCLVPAEEYTKGQFYTGTICPGGKTYRNGVLSESYCSGSLTDALAQFNEKQGNCPKQ